MAKPLQPPGHSLREIRKRAGCFDVASDNPAVETWRDVAPKEIEVVGRAVWMARRI